MGKQRPPPRPPHRIPNIRRKRFPKNPYRRRRCPRPPVRIHARPGSSRDQPMHHQRLPVTPRQAVPDQRPDRVRPHHRIPHHTPQPLLRQRPPTGEKIQRNRIRSTDRTHLHQRHRRRPLAPQPGHRQLPQVRHRHPRTPRHPPPAQHVSQLTRQQLRILPGRHPGLPQVPGRLLHRQRQAPQQPHNPPRHRRIDPRHPTGEQTHRFPLVELRHLHHRVVHPGQPRGHQQPPPRIRGPKRPHHLRIVHVVQHQQPPQPPPPQHPRHRRPPRALVQPHLHTQRGNMTGNKLRVLRRHPPHHVERGHMPMGVLHRHRAFPHPTRTLHRTHRRHPPCR